MDMSNQYVEFFAGLRDIVLGKVSPIYSWNMGFGSNLFGIISYYLASPLSLITVFFDNDNLPLGISILTMLKIGLSGLTFSIFLNKKFRQPKWSIVVFSLIYALMAYNIGYYMCIMWLDSVILLPIIILTLERLIDGKGFTPFVVSLFILFVSNYYSAYMVGIFCVLYFTYYYNTSENVNSSFLKTIGKFVGSTVLAGGMSSYLLIPTVFCMFNGKIGSSGYKPSGIIGYNPFILFNKMMVGNSYDKITYGGTPFVYIGVLSALLLFVFFISKRISLREKLFSFAVFSVILFSSVINQLDAVWHAFQAPNWFPFRYMFVLCFFALVCAYKAFVSVEEKQDKKDLIIPSVLLSGLFILSSIVFKTSQVILLINVIIVFSYGLLLWIKKSNKRYLKRLSTIIIIILCMGELLYNTGYIISQLDKDFEYQTSTSYSSFKSDITPIIDNIKKTDNSFYRIGKTFERSKNDSFGLNLNGIGHYSSAFDRNTNRLLRNLGFAQDYFWSSYYGSTLLTDSIFGVKYVLTNDSKIDTYKELFTNKDITAFENPYSLPIGFMVNSSVKNYYEYINPFYNQNSLINLMTDSTDGCFKDIDNVKANSKNIIYKKNKDFLSFSLNDNASEGYLDFSFKAKNNYPIYVSLPTVNNSDADCKMYINSEYFTDLFTSDTDRVHCIGAFEEGENVDIRIVFHGGNLNLSNFYFNYLNTDNLKIKTDYLKSNQLNVTKFDGTNIKGDITVDSTKKTLFTSIRDDSGWNIFVDGKKQVYKTFSDTLICIDLTEGRHTVEFKFVPKGLITGIIISAISVLVFISLCFWLQNKKSKKINSEKDDRNEKDI